MLRAWLLLCFFGGLLGCTSSTHPSGEAVRVRWTSDPETLDPLALSNQQATDAVNLLHLGLLQLDYQTGQHAPALARSLPTRQLLGDSLTRLDYYLRPEATWDNGRPVLATDVAFTLKLMRCPGLRNENSQAQTSFISDCQPDPGNLRHFTLLCRGQSADYPQISGDFPVLPEDALDAGHQLRAYSLAALRTSHAAPVAALVARYQQANLARHPERLPGCGPYHLASWQPNRALVFRRKPTWWADRLPQAPFVLQAKAPLLYFLVIPDAAAAGLALRRHELDVLPQVPARLFKQLQASAARQELAFYSTASYEVLTLGFNTQQPALRDKRTRQALGYLLDPAALLAATQLGQGQLTASLLPPSSRYYNDSLPLFAYQPARARALLRQAGWQHRSDSSWYRPGLASPLHLVVRYRAEDNTLAAVGLQWQAAAARLGIALDLRPTEGTVLTPALRAGEFDAYVRVVKGNPFAYNFAPLFHSAAIGEGNFTRFAKPATDHLLGVIDTTSQLRRRTRLLRQLQAMLHDEAPLVPLFVLPYRLAANRRLQGVTPSSLKPGYAAAAMSWQPAPTPPPAAAAR